MDVLPSVTITSSFFGLRRATQFKLTLHSYERIWDLMFDSQPLAEYWYHLFNRIVLHNQQSGGTAPATRGITKEEDDDDD